MKKHHRPVQPAAADAEYDKKGPIVYAQGKDTSGSVQPLLDKWNAAVS